MMKKGIVFILAAAAALALAGGCSNKNAGTGSVNNNKGDNMEQDIKNVELTVTPGQEAPAEAVKYKTVTVDTGRMYQTMESFGTSGAWWSQYVGGFEKSVDDSGVSTREAIATLLFDREKGIGLTCYRYNLGAGSADSKKGTFWDVHRRAQSFEIAPGVYDFSKDANAVWFLKKVVELGAEEVVLFCNSPLERLTDNGLAHMSEGGSRVNIQPENYGGFAKYCMDVAEHFIDEGIPVKFISPINEPQWDWYNGQEGCHYEPEQTRELYLAFLSELEARDKLEGVRLSGPESGEWKGRAQAYTEAILANEVLRGHFDTIDNHSYWSNSVDKQTFKNWMIVRYPDVKLRTSEWCEMVNGSDVTMDSAFHIAQEIADDIRILEVVSWQNWVGVAPGGYRDGLIYIDEASQKYRPLKRLWSFGNFSRYVRPGYVRVDIQAQSRDHEKMLPTAFTGVNNDGVEELVMVFINESAAPQEFVLKGCGAYDAIKMIVTSDNYDLECVSDEAFDAESPVIIPKRSVTTVVLSK